MFGKWFKRKSVPDNDGISSDQVGRAHFVKVYELVLSNMEDSPVYALTHQLSVGSEIGNIVISDPSVSPRHATFSLQDEVVSLIDHGSVSGTFVNGKKIEAGKTIILEESDVVLIGELQIRLKVRAEALSEERISEKSHEEVVDEKSEAQKKDVPNTTAKSPIKISSKEPVKKTSFSLSTPKISTNSLVRVFAVTSDFALSYVILTVLMPFDEFRTMLEGIPLLLADLIPVDPKALIADLGIDLSFLNEIGADLWQILSSTFQVVPFLIVYVFIRAASTLLLGVSISEFFLGVRSSGNKLWARIGGLLRVFIGLFTWPFLIFDLPALFSRRTFKEVITFTNIVVPSKFIAILGFIFYLPLILILCLIAPIAEGFQFPQAIIISDKIDQRIKVRAPVAPKGSDQVVSIVTDQSESLHLKITSRPSEVRIIPSFRFQGVRNKVHLKSGLLFYQEELKAPVELELFKTFDFRQLLGYGIKGNIFLYDRFPEIYNFVYEANTPGSPFKKNINAKAQQKFANEFIEFTKASFSLSLDTLLDFVQTESPLLKNYMDFRSSFFDLIEYKDFTDIGFIKIGDSIFMRVSYKKQKPFDLIIPLQKTQGRIFKVNFAKKEIASLSANKFYKFNLEKSEWLAFDKPQRGETLTSLQVFDLFSGPEFKTVIFDPATAQALYGYYYETSASILKKNDPVEKDLWKAKVSVMVEILERIPDREQAEGGVSPKAKLIQNLRDTVDALSNNNIEYFGISATTQL